MNRIYALIDPRTGLIRYVGITRSSLKARMAAHRYQARTFKEGRTHCTYWLRQLLDAGLEPAVILIEETADRSRESYWIAHYRAAGVDLTNATDGGEGTPGYPIPPDVLERRVRALRETLKAPEQRARLRANFLGRKHTEETLARMRENARGRRLPELTPESLEKLRRNHAAKVRRGDNRSDAQKASTDRLNATRVPARGTNHHSARLDEAAVTAIRTLYREGVGPVELGQRFGVTRESIWRIVTRRSWSHVP